MKKRLASIALALTLCIGMMPTAAWAEDDGISVQNIQGIAEKETMFSADWIVGTNNDGSVKKEPRQTSDGGIKWDEEGVEKDGWGYGAGPATKEEFLNRYKGLTDALLDNPHMFAFCYTQLYDVEQELNGLYTYERKTKFDMDVIKAINARKAAIED